MGNSHFEKENHLIGNKKTRTITAILILKYHAPQ